MSTKIKILEFLEKNRDIAVSGEQLAEDLKISRSAVWKAINELKKEGYAISASTNRGYTLSGYSDKISAEGIRVYLDAPLANIFVYDCLASTNITASGLAQEGAPHGTVVIANTQTAGKGRMGRSFYSPADNGVYMSLLLRPNLSAQSGPLVTTAAAVAVCRAIEKTLELNTEIKWVNDVLLNGKKICGILTEGLMDFESSTVGHMVVGIGVNVWAGEFPAELSQKACALKPAAITHGEGFVARNRLIAEVINEMMKLLENIESREFINEYRKRSVVIGKDILILRGNDNITAKALDVDDNGGLVVRFEDGSTQTLTSGEISIRGDFYND